MGRLEDLKDSSILKHLCSAANKEMNSQAWGVFQLFPPTAPVWMKQSLALLPKPAW